MEQYGYQPQHLMDPNATSHTLRLYSTKFKISQENATLGLVEKFILRICQILKNVWKMHLFLM